MWITKKTYEELVENNKALKKMNLSLMSDYNALSKENFELAKKLHELEGYKKPRKRTTTKKDFVKKTTTTKPRTKKEDK